MTIWQLASAAFFGYVALAAVLPRGLERRRRLDALAGAATGAGIVWVSAALPRDSVFNQWLLPPALLLLGYWASGQLFVAPMPRLEQALAAFDRRLAIQPLASRCPRAVAELLEFAYAAVYPLVPVALVVALGSGVTAERFWATILITDYICFGMLPWLQTRPPRSLGFAVPWRSTWRPVNERLLEAGSVRVNTFPSGHAAEGLALALLVLDAPAPLVVWMFVNAAAISAGAVLGRYHYAADALAGWLVALLVWGMTR
ncbi:MAG TPA: phosphatase PAP2 family protein [Vicinamibacterales bacterium]|nr:phosphatase PAP2 family protein [Vicinamibacterales bacterium]